MATKTKDRNYDEKYNYVPKDYGDLYLYYIEGDGFGNSLCHQLIRSFMPYATPEEHEILAHDVFLRCLKKEVLETGGSSRSEKAKALGKPGVFDPKKANFGGVIFFVTRTVCSNYLARKGRDPLGGLYGGSLVETDPETGVFERGTYSLDRLMPPDGQTIEDQLGDRKLVGEITRWAIGLQKLDRHIRDRKILPMLQMMTEGYEAKDMGPALGVSPSTIHNWQQIVREEAARLKSKAED
jgi:hypothetical protein